MNPHDQNHLPREASLMMGRLFATMLFGAAMFVVGYMTAEARFKMDPPPCKPVQQKQSEYPRTKAQVARFVEQLRNRDAGWIR
jgi:hypothetical protein